MSTGGALEDLVTQAPEAQDDDEKTKHGPAQSKFAQLCSCLFSERKRPVASKLASVVPTEAEAGNELAVAGDISDSETYPVQSPPLHKVPEPSREHIWGPRKNEAPQLGPQVGPNQGRKTLVLDLDETLVHSSFRNTKSADIIILVELEGEQHHVYVRKRPGVDEFLVRVGQWYEVVVYTASMAKYAVPLLDELDKFNSIAFRLFREACTRHPGGYVKDLSKLGRDLKHTIIIDNSPICYALQPNNAIPIRMWKDDPSDRELLDLIPILHSLTEVEDIPVVLKQIVWAPDED